REGELTPDLTRSQLYERTLYWMLGGSERDAALRPLLEELAAEMFHADDRRLMLPEGRVLDLFEHSNHRVPPLNGASDGSPRACALSLRDEVLRKKVLVRVGPQARLMTFGHRTLAEFLMAGGLSRHVRLAGGVGLVGLLRRAPALPSEIEELLDGRAWLR